MGNYVGAAVLAGLNKVRNDAPSRAINIITLSISFFPFSPSFIVKTTSPY